MRVHITNIYGFISTGAKAQNAVTDIAKRDLEYEELGIYFYPVESDSSEMLRTRLDGIMASLSYNEVVIMQSPTWNDIEFDKRFIGNVNLYEGVRKIIFIQDVLPLMYAERRGDLGKWIDLYNQADLIIAPSQSMVDFLRKEGLTVEKTVTQKMWDSVVSVDRSMTPPFQKKLNLAENLIVSSKAAFAWEWPYDNVALAITMNEGDWAKGKNITFLGWHDNDTLLADTLRKSGGFGLVWSENPSWREYMKLNASYQLSTYLAAGIPVVVPSGIAEQETILRKNLGLVVDSLDEAVERIEKMDEETYRQMTNEVEQFAYLLRSGCFTRKALTDAVFQLCDE